MNSPKKRIFLKKHLIFQLFIGLMVFYATAIDNSHFYRPTFFWGEPRFERPGLTTIQAEFATGQTHHSYNYNGQKTSLLNLYGPHALYALGKNNPFLDPSNNLDQLLIELADLSVENSFGKVLFNGHFRFFEAQFQIYQNLINGFFIQAHLPVRSLHISDIHMIDLSPAEGLLNKQTPLWVNFLSQFDAILSHHFLTLEDNSQRGVGDLSLLIGWAKTSYDTTHLDFIDVSTKIGILLPSSKKSSINKPFSLPLGYNGHSGVPLKFDCSFGYLEWLTLGVHIGALFLLAKHQEVALPTSTEQNGFILLTRTYAKVDPGTYWDTSIYIKADHFCKGISLLLAYLYTHKDRDCLKIKNAELFAPTICHDHRFKGWTMHELSCMIEWDSNCSKEEYKPIISLFYNWIIKGRSIFATSSTNMQLGLNFAWDI